MIKAMAGNLILLGLSSKNLEKLKEGKPIHIFGSELGIKYDIGILWGDTEEEIVDRLKPMIDDSTKLTKVEKH